MLSIQSCVRMKNKNKTHAVSSRLLPQCAGRDRNSLKSRRCGEANKRHSNLHDRALSNPSESSPRQQKQPRRYRATLKINLIKHILENSVIVQNEREKKSYRFRFRFLCIRICPRRRAVLLEARDSLPLARQLRPPRPAHFVTDHRTDGSTVAAAKTNQK